MSTKDRSPKKGNPKKAEVPRAGNAGGKPEGYRTLYVNESTGQTNYPRWREEIIKEAKSSLFFHTAKSLEEDREVPYPQPKLSEYLPEPEDPRPGISTQIRSASSQSRSPSRTTEQEAEPTTTSRRRGGKKATAQRKTRLLTDDKGDDDDDDEDESEPTRGRSRGSPKGVTEFDEETEMAREICKEDFKALVKERRHDTRQR